MGKQWSEECDAADLGSIRGFEVSFLANLLNQLEEASIARKPAKATNPSNATSKWLMFWVLESNFWQMHPNHYRYQNNGPIATMTPIHHSCTPCRHALDTKYSLVTCTFPSHFVRSAENRLTFCGFHDWTAKNCCFQRFCMVSTPEQSSAPPQRRSRLGPGCPGDAFRLPGYRIRWSVRFVLNVFYWCFVLSGT